MHKNVECNLAADVHACEVFISRSVRVQQTSSFIRDASLDKQPFGPEGCLRAFLLTERVPRPKVGCTLGCHDHARAPVKDNDTTVCPRIGRRCAGRVVRRTKVAN